MEMIAQWPSIGRRVGESLFHPLVEVHPWDVFDEENLRRFNQLSGSFGDATVIGSSDFDGRCQSWRHKGWWRKYVDTGD